jgi:hypothetical protein
MSEGAAPNTFPEERPLVTGKSGERDVIAGAHRQGPPRPKCPEPEQASASRDRAARDCREQYADRRGDVAANPGM